LKIELHITRKVLFEKYSIQNEIEYFFLSILDGCDIKILDSYPGSIFYLKNDKILFTYECVPNIFRVRYNLVWLMFKEKYLISNMQIQTFIKNLINKNFKVENVCLLFGIYLDELEVGLISDYTSCIVQKSFGKVAKKIYFK